METSAMINTRKEIDGTFVLACFCYSGVIVCSSQVALKSLPHMEDFLGVLLSLKGGVIYQSDLLMANTSLTTAMPSFLAAAQNSASQKPFHEAFSNITSGKITGLIHPL